MGKSDCKGCSSVVVPTWAYLCITAEIAQVADKIYYGELIPVKFLVEKRMRISENRLIWENYFKYCYWVATRSTCDRKHLGAVIFDTKQSFQLVIMAV